MTSPRKTLSKSLRIALSLAFVVHLLGVLLPPLSFQTRGPLGISPSVATLFAPLEGYSQFLYIDRGYAFFAPDPGPSHLIQAAITDRNGVQTEIMIPDLQRHWPRLLYHRHFMLAEFLEEIYEPPGPPPELVEDEPELAAQWQRSRARYEYVRQSVVEHLKHVNPQSDVAIRRIEHLIPGVLEYQQDPIELTDPRLYQVLLDQPVTLDDDLVAPRGPAETIPPPRAAEAEASQVADPTQSPEPPAETGQADTSEADASEADASEADRGETEAPATGTGRADTAGPGGDATQSDTGPTEANPEGEAVATGDTEGVQ